MARRRRSRDQSRVTIPKLPIEDVEEFVTPLGIEPVDPGRMRKRLAEFKSEVERILVSDDGS